MIQSLLPVMSKSNICPPEPRFGFDQTFRDSGSDLLRRGRIFEYLTLITRLGNLPS